MIVPFLQGTPLIDEIRRFRLEPGSLAVWWTGQSGYVVKSRLGTLVIDPYLSEHLTTKYAGTAKPHVRMTEAPCRGHELAAVGIDLVLSSHKHSDHLDPGTMPDLLAGSPGAVLGLPASIVSHAVENVGLRPSQLVGLEAGQTIKRAGFHVRAIPSAHEALDTDERGRHLYLGFVIEADGRRLYHSGDSLAYEGLVDLLGPGQFDALFVPINGRDPSRGVPGNMTAGEAVDLASAVRPRWVVPHHYDMFEFNTVPIEAFETEARRLPDGVRPAVLTCGCRWEIRP